MSCVDPESFVRGGCFFRVLFLVDERISAAIIGPPAKRHLNGVFLACRWWPNNECWLGSFAIFQGIQTCIAIKPYIFVIFQGVARTPCPHLWICPCMLWILQITISGNWPWDGSFEYPKYLFYKRSTVHSPRISWKGSFEDKMSSHIHFSMINNSTVNEFRQW